MYICVSYIWTVWCLVLWCLVTCLLLDDLIIVCIYLTGLSYKCREKKLVYGDIRTLVRSSKVTSVSHCDSLKPDKDIRQTIYYMFY